jgi:hypothetical protein
LATRDSGEDIAFFLYLLPLIASIAYGIAEWVSVNSKSGAMPTVAYLIVSKSPYLFLGSLVAICLGVIFEVRAAPSSERNTLVLANSTRMQILAVIVLIISFAAAISSAGYSNLGIAFTNFLRGTYAVIFAFFMLFVSILLSPSLLFGRAKFQVALTELLGMVFLAFSPLALYAALKANLPFAAAAAVPIVVFILGLVLVLGRTRILNRAKPSTSVRTPQKPET